MKLSNLPSDTNIKDISKIVWGGKVLAFSYESGQDYCSFIFLLPEACQAYYDATRKGIAWPSEPGRIIKVDRSIRADPLDNFQRSLAHSEVTRCVRLLGVPEGLSQDVLRKFVQDKGRKPETLLIGRDLSTGVSLSLGGCCKSG